MEKTSPPTNPTPKLPSRFKLPAMKPVVGLIVVVVVVAVGLAGYGWYQGRDKSGEGEETKKEQLAKNDEITQLKTAYDQATEPEKKYEAAINLGNKYLEKGGKDEAYEVFKQATEVHKDDPHRALNAYVAMANIADVNGDEATALEHYKKVLEVLKDQTDPSVVAMREGIQARVDQLSK